jgi:hypothetical protein
MAPITASLIATIQELAGRPLDFVVNTHAHGDRRATRRGSSRSIPAA